MSLKPTMNLITTLEMNQQQFWMMMRDSGASLLPRRLCSGALPSNFTILTGQQNSQSNVQPAGMSPLLTLLLTGQPLLATSPPLTGKSITIRMRIMNKMARSDQSIKIVVISYS